MCACVCLYERAFTARFSNLPLQWHWLYSAPGMISVCNSCIKRTNIYVLWHTRTYTQLEILFLDTQITILQIKFGEKIIAATLVNLFIYRKTSRQEEQLRKVSENATHTRIHLQYFQALFSKCEAACDSSEIFRKLIAHTTHSTE